MVYRIPRRAGRQAQLDYIQRALNELESGVPAVFTFAEKIIKDRFGDTVSVDQKRKELRKWGLNERVGQTKAVIAVLKSGQNEETMLTSNGITSVSSSDNSDTMDVDFYEYHLYDSGNLTFGVDNTSTTLTGHTAASIPTACRSLNRARLTEPAAGDIYFHEGGTLTNGVPDDATEVHLVIPAGDIQSQKCATSISSVDYWIITSATASVLEKTSSWAQFRIEIKAANTDHWYPITEWVGASDTSGKTELLQPGEFLIVPKNHDVRMVAIANTSGIYCAGGMSGPLAIVI